MDIGVRKAVAVGSIDPGIEGVVRWPSGDHDDLLPIRRLLIRWLQRLRRILPCRAFEDELEEDAVVLAHLPVLLDPGEESLALLRWHMGRAPADDHRFPPPVTTAPAPATSLGYGTRPGRRRGDPRWPYLLVVAHH